MPSANQIKVLVIHDDPLIRAGLVATLASYTDIEPVISECGTFEGSCDTHGMGILLVDVLVTNYANGIDLAKHLAHYDRTRGRPKIMIVTAHDREWEIRSAMERGIAGYLLAGCPLDHLVIGVRTVHRGARYLSAEVAQRLAESLSAEPLTGREEAVLQLVVDGLCNKAIAACLGVALGTVKTHLKAIFDKLDVQTRTQAVIAVARRGMLRQRMSSGTEVIGMTVCAGTNQREAVSC